ncbi:CrcB family protein [Orrella sp. 11846]|uniref:CrcB family protein n=1 Tax=Orrella sp. 11846 TaxID=3409913 RepID=UPI003B5B3BDC
MLTNALFVFFGGAIGAMIREGFMLMIPHVRGDFPLDIFVANILAAFLLGLATKLKQLSRVSDQFVLFVGTGVMGGMSTFSSYVYGAYSEMMTTGDLWWGVLYVIASLVLGYFATLLGLYLVRGSARQV